MQKTYTELVFIIDRSGSMEGLEADTIGGFNSMLAKQKEMPGEAAVTTVLFNESTALLHDRISIKGVVPITRRQYQAGGCTALLDAMGSTITKIVNVQRNTGSEARAGQVIFVIITDGLENSSREYSFRKISQMVETQKTKYGWEFIFLGANIDAIASASKMGIDPDRAANFNADSRGVSLNYETIGAAINEFRSCNKLSETWKDKIDDDFKGRGTTKQ